MVYGVAGVREAAKNSEGWTGTESEGVALVAALAGVLSAGWSTADWFLLGPFFFALFLAKILLEIHRDTF